MEASENDETFLVVTNSANMVDEIVQQLFWMHGLDSTGKD